MNTFGGQSLINAGRIRTLRKRFLRDADDCLRYANSLYAVGHRWPARGWLLMQRSAFLQLPAFSTSLQLQIGDVQTGTSITAGNLAIVQARCVTEGIATDPTSVYLVEITDARGVIANRWVQSPMVASYNVRAPAYPGGFYTPSLNAGVVPWTWATMIGDMWGQMPLLGAYPGLPATPSGTPENFWFPGVSAWDALCNVLDLVGMSVAVNLLAPASYSITVDGAADATFNGQLATFAPIRQDGGDWIDLGAGRGPGTVVVLFHTRYQQFGTEETIRADGLQWAMTPYYSIPVTSPAPFTSAPGVHYLWDDFTIQRDVNGNPLASDVATATTIASERVSQYFGRIYAQTFGYLNNTYAGVLPFYTGSQLDGVCWKQQEDVRAGWQTMIYRGPSPPWPDVVQA